MIHDYELKVARRILAVQWLGDDVSLDDIKKMIGLSYVRYEYDVLYIQAGLYGESGWVKVPLNSWVAIKDFDAWPISDKMFKESYKEVVL